MITTLVLALGLAAPCTRITVRTLNVVPVEEGVLARARAIVEKVFRTSSTEIVWIDCLPGATSCSTPIGPAEISLRIFRRSDRTKRAIGESIGGLALPGGEGAGIVHLHYDRLEDISRGEEVPLDLALGVTAAHEIGHLLIGPAHSKRGVMRANLGAGDWHDAAQGALLFDRAQSSSLSRGACRERPAEREHIAGSSQ